MPSSPYDIIAAQATRSSAYRPYLDPEYYCYPAEDFERETGLTGISTDYTMPAGKTPYDLFLALYHEDVQTHILDRFALCIGEVESLSPEHLLAYHATAKAELKAFRKQMKAAHGRVIA